MIYHDELMREGGLYCARHGHKFFIHEPIEVIKEDRKVLCVCDICQERRWWKLNKEKFKELLENIENEKIE